MSLGYEEFGTPSGTPVLFVHGYASSRWAAGWTLSAGTLDKYGVRVVSVDRPGYGRSSPQAQWTRDTVGVLDRLGIERVVAVGVSMGASSALRLAAAHPGRVAGVALLGGMPPVPVGERWAPASRADAFYWRLARRAPWLLGGLCAMSAKAMASAASGDAAALTARVGRALPEADLRVFRTLTSTAEAAFIADIAESARQGGAAMAHDLRAHLRPWGFEPKEVDMPVHLLHGIDDPKVPVDLVRRLAARLPRATADYLPGGHFAAFADQDALMGVLLRLASG
ncbi:alpha/beta fold hydrolase [Sinosporangium siamense]|uniref:Alpha/beta hydrolase n=1 Tax=Sinosporangium siamense TaxID=1367973 RepID=A0A919VEI8_9ACTN|nr:alpha/beta hydrolase [Sinosporangium siamense]GII95164.1 alpha/beta hydrolase [Sinosporangium siamense]